jgi:predicted AAA+ superfamily ATPase
MVLDRLITSKIFSLKDKFPVLAITGPRQSGKSTLIQNIFPDKPYVTLEDPDIRSLATEDPRGFLSNYPDGAILDEVQHVPQLFSYIQGIVDKSDKTGMFILSGSQNFLLMESITQSLAGRVAIFRLLPFSYAELQDTKFKTGNTNQWIFKGGYPRIYDKNIAPADFYPNYIQTYLERDVRELKAVNDLPAFIKFLKMCAARVGNLLNISSLANDCGISPNTAKAWLSVLEASYVIYLLQPFHSNFNKRLIKSPKLYFYDTGLACSLLNIEKDEQLQTHFLRGGLFENMVIAETLKHFYNAGKQAPCFFWQDKLGREIDLILETANKIIPIEIKSGMTLSKDYFKNLSYWNKLSGNSEDNSFVVYAGIQDLKTKDGQYLTLKGLNTLIDHIL